MAQVALNFFMHADVNIGLNVLAWEAALLDVMQNDSV
jgi:hypothetical protein